MTQTDSASWSGSSPRPLVLILNHNPAMVVFLQATISELGYETTVHAGEGELQGEGAEALIAYLNERDPDAVVVDIPPPFEGSAAAVLRVMEAAEVRERKWVAISTSQAALDLVATASRAAVLLKPFDIGELEAALSTALPLAP